MEGSARIRLCSEIIGSSSEVLCTRQLYARPDCAAAVRALSSHLTHLTAVHVQAALRVVDYLFTTRYRTFRYGTERGTTFFHWIKHYSLVFKILFSSSTERCKDNGKIIRSTASAVAGDS